MASNSVLFVDDEENILKAVERLFIHDDIDVLMASSAAEALKIIASKEIAVIVSDNHMPGMKGIEFLSRVKNSAPDTVRIIMTAYGDLQTAMEAINRGEVFRFIEKPWDGDCLVNLVQEGVHRYRFRRTLRSADDASLLPLVRTIELKDPYTKGHCERVAIYALKLAEAMELPEETKSLMKFGCWLHDSGKIGVPDTVLLKPGKLDDEEFDVIKKHPEWGADIIREASLNDSILNIALYHHERYNGRGYPSGLSGRDIPLEARITAVADVFDALTTNRAYRPRFDMEKTISIMISMSGDNFDPDIFDIFMSLQSKNDMLINDKEKVFSSNQ